MKSVRKQPAPRTEVQRERARTRSRDTRTEADRGETYRPRLTRAQHQASIDLARQREVEAALPRPTASVRELPWFRDEQPIPFVEFADLLGDHLRLTPAQRVLCAVAWDGAQPCEFSGDDAATVETMFGGALGVPPGISILVLRLGRWSGKTTMCSARAIYRMLTADLSNCGPADVPAAAIIAPTAKVASIAMQAIRSMMQIPALVPTLDSSTKDAVTIRRPQDGREVQCLVVAKGRGGASIRGRSLLEVMIDESEFVPSSGADAVVSDGDLVDAAMPRLMPGGRVLLVSTPWPAPSETQRLFDLNWGAPSSALVARAPTTLMRPDEPGLLQKIEDEVKRKPQNARREFFCELVDGAGGAFFDASLVSDAVSVEQTHGDVVSRQVSAGIDPAFLHDSSALAIVRRVAAPQGGSMLEVVALDVVTPEPQRPLVPTEVLDRFAVMVKAAGTFAVATDIHRVGTVRRAAALAGLQISVTKNSEEALVYLRDVLREHRIALPNDPRLLSQLSAVTFRPRSTGGMQILIPRSRDSGHADLVSALAHAVEFDRRHGPLVRREAVDAPPSPVGAFKPFDGFAHAAPQGVPSRPTTAGGRFTTRFGRW